MKREPAKRSSLFLMELIIAILFFCLASMVCVQIFVKARLISRQAQEMGCAVEKVSGFTELFLSGKDFTEQIRLVTEGMAEIRDTSDIRIYYDARWQVCEAEDASYLVKIQTGRKDGLLHASFCAKEYTGKKEGKSIYEVETDRYPDEEEVDAN